MSKAEEGGPGILIVASADHLWPLIPCKFVVHVIVFFDFWILTQVCDSHPPIDGYFKHGASDGESKD
jgi:hypothetical protein